MSVSTSLPLKRNNLWAFWALIAFSILFANAPVISWFLAPITQFTTMVHEMGHALVCMATGGYVNGLTIVSDGQGHGGLTNCMGGNPFLYAQAGYLGTAVFGSFLIWLCQFPRAAKSCLCVMGGAFAMATLALVGANVLHTGFQGFFSFVWGLAMSAFLVWAGIKWKPAAANFLMLFLAVQTALNSVTSLLYLAQFSMGLSPGGGWSDATNMQMMTGIPAACWAIFWALSSIAMVGFTIWRVYGFRKNA
ncbi:MAG TPA: M50 family metallopeptidase [Planktothrix sp.]|jgi:hypothetical protein